MSDAPDLRTIHGVEIFSAGTHNGDSYSIADLDEIVTNFDRVGFVPPVTLGHTQDSGAPACGSATFRSCSHLQSEELGR